MLSLVPLLSVIFLGGPLHDLPSILPNPSMEQDRNRDDQPDDWTPDPWKSQAKLDWDRSVAHTGRASLRIEDPGYQQNADWRVNSARWSSPPRPVAAGTRYHLEAWIKTERLTGRAGILVSWRQHGRYLGQSATRSVRGTTEWQKVTLDTCAPQEADELVVVFSVGYGSGKAWCDDIRVTGKSTPLPRIEYRFTDTGGWFPFEFPLDDTNRDVIDFSHFLHRPAGRFGFVHTTPDGHLAFDDGRRARFIGVNLGGGNALPPKAQAKVMAARFAKYGFNLVRLHSIDSRYAGLIDYGSGTSQEFSPEALDRLDFLIAQLKENGIYVYLDMLDYRMFRTADGVKGGDQFTHNWSGSSKGASIFDDRMIELQKDYATKLLTHRNPYTGLRYVDDPAIALIETTNENSVFYFLLNANMSTPYYRESLRRKWNVWLKRKYATHRALRAAWTDPAGRCELMEGRENLDDGSIQLPRAEITRFSRGSMRDRRKYRMGPLRMRDALLFFAEIEARYFREMQHHFKSVLGVRVPVSGTNQVFTVADTCVNGTENDFTCGNQYWFHPDVRAKPYPKFANVPRVRSDFPRLRGPIPVLARNTVAGKPNVVSEFNYPWPNEYRCEGTLLTTAYACLQDWDGLLFFAYDQQRRLLRTFDVQSDPARWGCYPAAVAMFHRHDVSVARNEIAVAHSKNARFLLQPDERSAPYSAFRYLSFLSKVRNAFPEDVYRGTADAVLAAAPSDNLRVDSSRKVIRFDVPPWHQWQLQSFVQAARKLHLPGYARMPDSPYQLHSDTGELSLDYKAGWMRIDTPRTQAAIGFLRDAGSIRLSDVALLQCRTEFATVSVSSLDALPIGRSRSLLVTAVGRVENSNQGFWPQPVNPKSWSPFTTWMLPAPGRRPVIVEPIDASVEIRIPTPTCRVHVLDPTGKRVGELQETREERLAGGFALCLNPRKGHSIWFEIACR